MGGKTSQRKLERFLKGELTFHETEKLNELIFDRLDLQERIEALLANVQEPERGTQKAVFRMLQDCEMQYRNAIWGHPPTAGERFSDLIEADTGPGSIV